MSPDVRIAIGRLTMIRPLSIRASVWLFHNYPNAPRLYDVLIVPRAVGARIIRRLKTHHLEITTS